MAVLACALLASGCGGSTASTQGDGASTSTTSGGTNTDLTSGFEQASWASNVTITYEDGALHFVSDGVPNHERNAQYALPNAGVMVPDASTATAGDDPTVAQAYDFTIRLTPTKASSPTSTSLGNIGLMISGASLFNPYEGDNETVATASNFSVVNADGDAVWFLDDCSGHPTPMGQYHYHALPACVTAQVDQVGGPSHIIGIAFDGYPIYGDRDIAGDRVTAEDLDECNGITSPTPEFPNGVYHYVLLDTADATSSIRCLSGVVDDSLTAMPAMPGMGAPPGAG